MAAIRNVRFYIRNKKETTPQQIYLSIFISKDNRLFYPTGVKVNPKHWDSKMDRIKSVSVPELTVNNKHMHEIAKYDKATKDNLNQYLANLRIIVDSVVSECMLNQTPLTKEIIVLALNNYITPPAKEEGVKFFDYLESYIKDMESGARLIKGNKLADPKTVQRYRTAKSSLLEFETTSGNPITFDTFDETLWDSYIRHLTFVKKYKINNIGFYQKQTLIYLKAARKDKVFEGDWIDEKTVLTENPDDVFWDKKELAHMETYDLSDNPRLDRIRDLTLIGCNTGFRISDWKQVHADNIHITSAGNKYLEIIPDKENATPPSTPLFPIVERILEKYNGQLPIISDQKYNEALKDLCKLIGQTKKVKVRYVQEGKLVNKTVEKYTQVSSHTCRRSFATNLFLDGFEPYLIMKATGHTSEKNFRKYLKLDSSGSVDAIAKRVKYNKQDSKSQTNELT